MPANLASATPNPYFPKHKYHGIPVARNIKPIRDCKLHHCVGPAATVQEAVAVHILTPEHLWGTFQVEAENILMVNGSFEGNERERNRRINAAYAFSRNKGARLWLETQRMQFVLAAARQFNSLLNGPERPYVEASMRAIAAGGGVA